MTSLFQQTPEQPRLIINRGEKKGERLFQNQVCGLLEKCGACLHLSLNYRSQLAKKKEDLLSKIAAYPKLARADVIKEFIPSEEKKNYRHTVKLVVSERISDNFVPKKKPTSFRQIPHNDIPNRWIDIGLYRPGSHYVVDLPNCPVQTKAINDISHYLRFAIKKNDVSVYNPRTRKGALRYLVVRTSRNSNQALVTLVVNEFDKTSLRTLACDLAEKFTFVEGVLAHVNSTPGNAIFSEITGSHVTDSLQNQTGETFLLAGNDSISEKYCHLNFRFSSTSFMQANPSVAEKMYLRIAELADIGSNESALDLYCGVGTISLFLAQKAKNVIGIDEVTSSIEDAKKNARLNHFNNTQFYSGKVESVLPSLIAEHKLFSTPQLITLNPSRKGAEKSALDAINELAPASVIYMSCYPDSMLKDLNYLCSTGKYEVTLLEPYDMFPGTSHYEVLALLKKI